MTISPGASVTAVVQIGAAVGASISPPASVDVDIGTETYRDREPYTGEYTATPSRHVQVFATAGKSMTANFAVNPIPHNYGLITYDGGTITVS